MANYKTILIPTDFSTRSESSYRYACEFAKATGAKLHFLNVIEAPYDFPSRMDDILKASKKEHKKKLESIIQDLQSFDDYSKLKIDFSVVAGKVSSEILSAIDKFKPDLVVMGTGGETGIKQVLYGSLTNRLLIDSPVPVLAITEKTDYREIKNVVFSTNLQENDPKLIKKTEKLARLLHAKVKAVHVAVNRDFESDIKFTGFKKVLKSELDESIPLELITAPTFLEGIAGYIQNKPGTLLVMSRNKKKLLEWMLLNNTAREVSVYTSVPLLLIPAGK
jgi:nucleotide-binding universal stress UspA family protein